MRLHPRTVPSFASPKESIKQRGATIGRLRLTDPHQCTETEEPRSKLRLNDSALLADSEARRLRLRQLEPPRPPAASRTPPPLKTTPLR
jgi:hypothetical protein